MSARGRPETRAPALAMYASVPKTAPAWREKSEPITRDPEGDANRRSVDIERGTAGTPSLPESRRR
jgi:hypothetical protein